MLKAFTTILALALNLATTAQVAEKIWAGPDELKDLARRILVVELPGEDPKLLDALPKHATEKEIAEHRASIESYWASLESYRAMIEPAIREHWKYNEEIEFKTTAEIFELFEKRSTKHVALLKVVLENGMGISRYTTRLGCPAIILARTDGDSKLTKSGNLLLGKYDYQMYLATTTSETGDVSYTPALMKFTLLQAQKHLAWIIKNGKSLSYVKYCKAMAEANCAKLHRLEMVVPEDGMHPGTTQEMARENYPYPMQFLSVPDLEATYTSGTEGNAVLFTLPVAAVSGTLKSYLAYLKVFVDPSTNEVVGAIIPGIGVPLVRELLVQDLKRLDKCD